MNKELGGWEIGGGPELLPCVDDDIDEYFDEDWDHWELLPPSTQRLCTAGRSRPRAPVPSGRDCRQ